MDNDIMDVDSDTDIDIYQIPPFKRNKNASNYTSNNNHPSNQQEVNKRNDNDQRYLLFTTAKLNGLISQYLKKHSLYTNNQQQMQFIVIIIRNCMIYRDYAILTTPTYQQFMNEKQCPFQVSKALQDGIEAANNAAGSQVIDKRYILGTVCSNIQHENILYDLSNLTYIDLKSYLFSNIGGCIMNELLFDVTIFTDDAVKKQWAKYYKLLQDKNNFIICSLKTGPSSRPFILSTKGTPNSTTIRLANNQCIAATSPDIKYKIGITIKWRNAINILNGTEQIKFGENKIDGLQIAAMPRESLLFLKQCINIAAGNSWRGLVLKHEPYLMEKENMDSFSGYLLKKTIPNPSMELLSLMSYLYLFLDLFTKQYQFGLIQKYSIRDIMQQCKTRKVGLRSDIITHILPAIELFGIFEVDSLFNIGYKQNIKRMNGETFNIIKTNNGLLQNYANWGITEPWLIMLISNVLPYPAEPIKTEPYKINEATNNLVMCGSSKPIISGIDKNVNEQVQPLSTLSIPEKGRYDDKNDNNNNPDGYDRNNNYNQQNYHNQSRQHQYHYQQQQNNNNNPSPNNNNSIECKLCNHLLFPNNNNNNKENDDNKSELHKYQKQHQQQEQEENINKDIIFTTNNNSNKGGNNRLLSQQNEVSDAKQIICSFHRDFVPNMNDLYKYFDEFGKITNKLFSNDEQIASKPQNGKNINKIYYIYNNKERWIILILLLLFSNLFYLYIK